MTQTDNYGLNIVEGTDLVNPLTQANPNFEKIDEQMKLNSERGITTATELKAGKVHALTRLDGDVAVFRFTATTNYVAGETFTVDGVQVTALLTTGQQLSTGAYIIGSEVLCVLKGTLLTFVISGATNAVDSEKLGGELPNYYAKEDDLKSVRETGIATAETATKNAQEIRSLNASLNNIYDVRTLPTLAKGSQDLYWKPQSYYTGLFQVSYTMNGYRNIILFLVACTNESDSTPSVIVNRCGYYSDEKNFSVFVWGGSIIVTVPNTAIGDASNIVVERLSSL